MWVFFLLSKTCIQNFFVISIRPSWNDSVTLNLDNNEMQDIQIKYTYYAFYGVSE